MDYLGRGVVGSIAVAGGLFCACGSGQSGVSPVDAPPPTVAAEAPTATEPPMSASPVLPAKATIEASAEASSELAPTSDDAGDVVRLTVAG